MNHLTDLLAHTPKLARSSVASWQAGGPQRFPTDPVADAYRHRLVQRQTMCQGQKLTRRIPAVKVA